uniref:Fibrinogen C-terminal domain-containing protein n=4 Tax=Ciona savignyi TaxID=51511 RepID=H2ZEJ6_CIOSA
NGFAESAASSCSMKVGKMCNEDGSCQYKVNVPSFDIVGSLATMAGAGNTGPNCDNLTKSLEILKVNQAQLMQQNERLMLTVTNDLSALESRMSQNMKVLSNSVRSLETARNESSAVRSEDNDRLPERNDPDQDSIELLVRMGKLTTPKPSTSFRSNDDLVRDQGPDFQRMFSELRDFMLESLQGVENKVTAKIEALSLSCTGQGKKDTDDDENDTLPSSDEVILNLTKGPQMMLCKTCCERVSFAEYTRAQDESDEVKDALPEYTTGQTISVERFEQESQEIPIITNTSVSDTIGSSVRDANVTVFEEGSALNPPDDSDVQEEVANRTILERIYQTTVMRQITTPVPSQVTERLPYDCAELYTRGNRTNGIYEIKPNTDETWMVYCDMETAGGGWTVIQKRVDGEENFSRNWKAYKNGFGDKNKDHWIGLERMHHLTTSNKSRRLKLRIDLIDWDDVNHYAEYETFRVRGEGKNYQLIAKKFSGTAGDALNYGENYNHNMQAFTTFDRDNDGYALGNCGRYYRSGWWFNACFAANLNGNYYTGPYRGVQNGIYWGTWYKLSDSRSNARYSFKYVDMKVRPLNFEASTV